MTPVNTSALRLTISSTAPAAVSQFVGGDLIHRELSGLHQLYIPHIFSYLNEDIDFVLNELKAKGLCRDFLAQQKDRGDRTHV
ncbi:prophage derepression protein [Escherichia coli]|nr:prophage derepression protein [Escherichia coli]